MIKQIIIWIACLSLADESDYHSKDTFAHMKEKIGKVNDEKFCVFVARHLHDDRSTVLTIAAVARIEEKK